ncbi:MAG: hypothetical protein B6244_00440 [Candidatus Cloacimonetes bacterium 4572_55]|nr:MAG: hypothetical protein B6244_00440 [Candidatus Cloacimonetes bacterium 4572_55]
MRIQAYFDRIKQTVDQFSTMAMMLDSTIQFEDRPGDQGYLNGTIRFVDGSALHFSEYIDAEETQYNKVTYRYHYQDANNELIFRYDNAIHRPKLPYREHKHVSAQISQADQPSLNDVLFEIFESNLWI